jgi:hypothetical protein
MLIKLCTWSCLEIRMQDEVTIYTVCLKSKCTDFPMDELEM